MLEGLMHAYLESLQGAWQPRDEPLQRFRDSPIGQTALSSRQSNQGKTRYADKMDGRKRRGNRPNRLREC